MSEVKTVELEDIRPYRFVLHRIHTNNGWSFPRHRHCEVFEFYYLFEGNLTHTFDDGTLDMNEGDFISVGEEEFHSVKGRVFGFYNLILPVKDWEDFTALPEVGRAYRQLEQKGRMAVHIPPRLRPQVMNMLDELFLYQKLPFGDLLLQKFLISFITDLSEPSDHHPSHALPLWMESLLAISVEQLDKGLTPGEMAKMCQRTPEHLARSFKRYLNTTPSSWLNDEKLKRACLLLEHSNTAVLDIALSLGYGNLNYFYKLFSRKYGTPPGEFRRNHSRIQSD
jgi:AraC-like DNA-binding protein